MFWGCLFVETAFYCRACTTLLRSMLLPHSPEYCYYKPESPSLDNMRISIYWWGDLKLSIWEHLEHLVPVVTIEGLLAMTSVNPR